MQLKLGNYALIKFFFNEGTSLETLEAYFTRTILYKYVLLFLCYLFYTEQIIEKIKIF